MLDSEASANITRLLAAGGYKRKRTSTAKTYIITASADGTLVKTGTSITGDLVGQYLKPRRKSWGRKLTNKAIENPKYLDIGNVIAYKA